MVVLGLVLVFLVIPAALIVASVLLPVMARFWLLFVAFPVALVLFAVARHLRASRDEAGAARRRS